jgi:hypothetical protein
MPPSNPSTPKKKKSNTGRNVKKLEFLCIIGTNIKCCTHYGKENGRSSKKLKIELQYDSATLILSVHPKEWKAGSHRDICAIDIVVLKQGLSVQPRMAKFEIFLPWSLKCSDYRH